MRRVTDRESVRRLQTVRALRSLGQGALLVTFAIYLGELGWPAGSIGLLLSVGGLLNAALSVPIGIASDRIGRKQFVMANEAVIVVAGIIATLSAQPVVLTVASLLGAFGRGQVGMVGPAGPAEEAWMAVLTAPWERGRIYSNTAAINFVGLGLGSLSAGLIPLWSHWLPGSLAHRPFFALVVCTGLVNLLLLAGTRTEPRSVADSGAVAHEPLHASPHEGSAAAPYDPLDVSPEGVGAAPHALVNEPATGRAAGAAAAHATNATNAANATNAITANPPMSPQDEARVRRHENRLLLKLSAINGINAFAIGLTAPLLAYWFYVKFGAGPEALGPVFALTHFATGAASATTGRVAGRIGLVRSIVNVRLTAVLLLIALPIVPFFWLAAVIHMVRSALNRGTAGTRQALAVSLVRESRRGFASSMNAISTSLPNALGPVIAGLMLEHDQLTLPFLIAALLQFAYGILFMRLFQAYDPTVERPQKSVSSPGSTTTI